MFKITIVNDVSLADLAALHQQGESVLRSAHVGNQYGANMAVFNLQIPGVLYDRMAAGRDQNYHPHLRLRTAMGLALGEPGQHIVARTGFAANHGAVLRHAFPGTHFETHTDYLLRHQGRVELLSILSLFSDQLVGKGWKWHRYVNDAGEIVERKADSWQQIVREGIFGVNADTYGWIPPNVFNVLLYALYESLEHDTRIVHHLSGPDMFKYISGLSDDLGDMWVKLADYVGATPDIEFRVYPTAHAKFVTTANKRGQLDDLLAIYHDIQKFNEEKGVLIQAATETERHALIGRLSAETNERHDSLAQAMDMCPELFVPLSEARHLTHHDAERSGLYVPSLNNTLTLGELSAMELEMLRFGKKRSPKRRAA